MQYSLALQDAKIMGIAEGIEKWIEKGHKDLIFKMFKKDKTVDEVSDLTDFERTKILELKNEYDQLATQL